MEGVVGKFVLLDKFYFEDAPFHIVPSHIREGIRHPNIYIPIIDCI